MTTSVVYGYHEANLPGGNVMSANTHAFTVNDVFVVVLGLAAAALVFFMLTGRALPLISDDRGALLALGLIGFVMCSLGGIGKVQSALGWTHPITIAGMVLGIAAMLIVILPLINVKLPVLTTDRSAFIALAVVMLIKVGLSGVSRFIV
jgi:hypothetical protein